MAIGPAEVHTVTGIGNAIILRHRSSWIIEHAGTTSSPRPRRVRAWKNGARVFIGRASHAVRDLELQGQTILLFSKFIVDLAIDLLGIFVSIYAEVHEHSYIDTDTLMYTAW